MTPRSGDQSRVRVPGLDGLRAVAVVAVLLYHGGFGWARGGYLGVDLFFVLSGFLITGLLMEEYAGSGGVALKAFWIRRIRRLVPAQVALLLALLIYIFLFHRPELYEFRGQAIAGIASVMNWFLIASNQSYFDAIGRPPALRHLWSLAIEMQFYLAWPIVFGLLLKVWGKRLSTLLTAVIGGALFSSVLMAVLYRSDNPSTAYYSTFTRLTGLLLGAALALVWRPKLLATAPVAQLGRKFDQVGIAALAISLLFYMKVSDQAAGTYRIGFLLFSLVSVVLIAVASHPTAWLAGPKGFGHPALVAIGARSYGIYLWHWPVFAYSWPSIDTHLGRGPLFVVRMIITLVLSELCFRFVERPWHSRQRSLAGLRALFARPAPGELARPVLVGIGSLLVLTALLFTALAPVHKDEIVADIEEGQAAIEARNEAPPPSTSTTVRTPETTTTTVPVTTPEGLKRIPDFSVDGKPPYVTAIGDSVMVGAAKPLYDKFGDRIFIDATVGRQAKAVPDRIKAITADRGLGDVLLIHIGTNGWFLEDQIKAVVEAAGDTPIVFLTAKANRSWVKGVNDNLKAATKVTPNTYLIDWETYAGGHPDWFGHDGLHPDEDGRIKYAELIFGSLTGKPPAA